MKKFAITIVALAIAISLTACNQSKIDNQNANVASTATTASAPMNHSEMNHEMHMASATASSTAGQPPHIMAYMDMMSKMHDDMAKGVQAKNADVGFAQGMIPHHQGAIEMAKVELQYGKDSEMKALAQKIVDAQQGEIKYMQDWLRNDKSNASHADTRTIVTESYQSSNQKNHDAMMQGVMDADPDVAFVKGMIPHHQGAIDMAEVELRFGETKEMKKLAQQIKQAQTPEIKQMQDWLAKKGIN